MLVIGLTGGIGSGKSTVAQLFADRHVPIIDADVIAREVTQPNEKAFDEICAHFGSSILAPNGTLDRLKLRHIIFEQDNERQWLEKLLHPIIEEKIIRQVQQLSAPYCITVIPLLLEVGAYPFIDRILVVDTPEHLQIERVKSRDKVPPLHVESILKTQVERGQRLSKAHDVILNDGIIADLLPQVQQLHEKYLRLSTAGQR